MKFRFIFSLSTFKKRQKILRKLLPSHFSLPFSEYDARFLCDDLFQILLSFNYNPGEILHKYFAKHLDYNKFEELNEYSPIFWDWMGDEFLKKSMEHKHVEVTVGNIFYRMLPLRRDQNKDIFE
jgi:hypothetical protein